MLNVTMSQGKRTSDDIFSFCFNAFGIYAQCGYELSNYRQDKFVIMHIRLTKAKQKSA